MKKTLKKREIRGQKNLQAYACGCRCGGCGSAAADYEIVYTSAFVRIRDDV